MMESVTENHPPSGDTLSRFVDDVLRHAAPGQISVSNRTETTSAAHLRNEVDEPTAMSQEDHSVPARARFNGAQRGASLGFVAEGGYWTDRRYEVDDEVTMSMVDRVGSMTYRTDGAVGEPDRGTSQLPADSRWSGEDDPLDLEHRVATLRGSGRCDDVVGESEYRVDDEIVIRRPVTYARHDGDRLSTRGRGKASDVADGSTHYRATARRADPRRQESSRDRDNQRGSSHGTAMSRRSAAGPPKSHSSRTDDRARTGSTVTENFTCVHDDPFSRQIGRQSSSNVYVGRDVTPPDRTAHGDAHHRDDATCPPSVKPTVAQPRTRVAPLHSDRELEQRLARADQLIRQLKDDLAGRSRVTHTTDQMPPPRVDGQKRRQRQGIRDAAELSTEVEPATTESDDDNQPVDEEEMDTAIRRRTARCKEDVGRRGRRRVTVNAESQSDTSSEDQTFAAARKKSAVAYRHSESSEEDRRRLKPTKGRTKCSRAPLTERRSSTEESSLEESPDGRHRPPPYHHPFPHRQSDPHRQPLSTKMPNRRDSGSRERSIDRESKRASRGRTTARDRPVARRRGSDNDDTDSRHRSSSRKRHRHRTRTSGRGGHHHSREDGRRSMKPDKFDGSQCVETFLVKFENCARYNRWKDEDRVAYLRSCLTGPADSLVMDTGSANYEELKEKLRSRYGSRGQREKFHLELMYRKRRQNESVQDLARDIERLATLAYPETDVGTRNQLASDAFINALTDLDVAMKVREREPRDLYSASTLTTKIEVLHKARDMQERMKPRFNRMSEVMEPHTDKANEKHEGSRNGKSKPRKDRPKQSQPSGAVDVQLETPQSAESQDLRNQMDALTERFSHMEKLISSIASNRVNSPATQSWPISSPVYPDVNFMSQQSTAPPVGQLGPQRPPPICYGCGQPGHFRRNCPQQQNQPPSSSGANHARGVAGPTRAVREAYLPVKIGRREYLCLLDTGSELTIIPASIPHPKGVRPVHQLLLAANGTEIPVLGEATIVGYVRSKPVKIRGLVSEHVADVMLGLDWLHDNFAMWNFATGEITLNGESISLTKKDNGNNWCRRVVLADNVIVPARSERDLPTNLVCDRLDIGTKSTVDNWATCPEEFIDGVLVARTALPNRATDLPVRVINVSDKPARIEKGTTIAGLETLTPLSCNSTETKNLQNEGVDVIEEMLSRVDDSVPESTRQSLRQLLHRYSSVFSRNELDLGWTNIVTHSIDTGDSKPFRQPLRRYPPVHLEAMDQHLVDMQKQGIIEPARSPWASNIVLARKKDGSLRCCIDYRQLNSVTRKDAYPLPRTDACLDAMSGTCWFSTFDMRSSYHQVAMSSDDADKTAFITRRGMFRFRTMPFGLCNAGATFQRLMDLLLNGLNLEACLVYLDDIIIFSTTLEQHLDRLAQVLDRLQRANLKLKPSKCALMQTEVTFLGHKVSVAGIATDPEKIRLIADWPTPQNLKQLRGFLGLTSYYRRFIESYSNIAAPLNAMTRKGQSFIWTEESQTAFQKLKDAMSSPPVLAMPDNDGQMILDTDASDVAIGAVLSQVQGGLERVIAFAGRTLARNESNYCVTRKELLSVVYFTKHFRQYLLGRKFIIRTDHAALAWLKRTPEPIGQNARWLELLGEFDFEIQHRSGARHGNADAMSRHPCLNRPSCTACHPEVNHCRALETEQSPFLGELADHPKFSSENIAQEQRSDRNLNVILTPMECGTEKPPWSSVELQSSETKTLWNEWQRLVIKDNVLCRKWISPDGLRTVFQVVMPYCLRSEFIQLVHSGATGGHLGRSKTEDQVRRRAYWPGWMSDVRIELRKCTPCARYHRGDPPRQFNLNPFPAGEPFETISIDITGKHPRSSKGNEYILTVVDSFSKFAEAYPIRAHTAPIVARTLATQFFPRYGTPMRLLSDQAPEFESELFQELCRIMEIDKIRTSPYKPSTNSLVERFHRTLNSMIAKAITSDSQRDWDQKLPFVMAAYRAARHESTGYSPNFLIFGREARAPIDLLLGPAPGEEQHYFSTDEYVAELQQMQRQSYAVAREHLGVAAERRKDAYDIRVKPAKFAVGQWVWYLYPRRYTGRSPKWSSCYQGPYLVVRVIEPCDFVIKKSRRSTPIVVHGDKLKPFFGTPPSSWLQPESGTDVAIQNANDQPTIVNESAARPKKEAGRPRRVSYDVKEDEPPEPRAPRERRRPARFSDFVM